MPTTVTQATTSNVSTHHLDWHGLAGAVFWLLLAALVMFIVGFATPGWSVKNDVHIGLWEMCHCGIDIPDEDSQKATQAMEILGLIALVLAATLGFIYMFFHKIGKNKVLIAMTVLQYAGVVFMVIGFIIFGSERSDLSYSFAFCVLASLATLIAAVLSTVQLVQSRH